MKILKNRLKKIKNSSKNATLNHLLFEILLPKNIIENNQDSVNDYKNGHDRAIKYLMGQIMKETKGKANPRIANEILIEELNR